VKRLFVLVFILFAHNVHASPMIAIGTNANFQLATSGRAYEVQTPLAARVGYRFSFADLFAEYSYVHSSTGTDMVSIAQTNHELLIWLRKRFLLTARFRPFVALGGGAHLQVVTTRFGSSANEDSGVDPEVAGSGGLEFKITPSIALSAEGRATLGEGYSPDPMLSLASYLSFTF
jgi:hypothetical protein